MESYTQAFLVDDAAADRFGRLKASAIFYYCQEAAGGHCKRLALDWDTLAQRHMFWAVIRQRVEITRLPRLGETITLKTWPMPATRTAYPRSTVAYDSDGNEVFRAIGVWVLMDTVNRSMILPAKSGVTLDGLLDGKELAIPGGLMPKPWENTGTRTVQYSELDRNGHMNNTRYLDWVEDLLGSGFHKDQELRECTVCYVSEAKEGETLRLNWQQAGDAVRVDGYRQENQRVFSAQAVYVRSVN